MSKHLYKTFTKTGIIQFYLESLLASAMTDTHTHTHSFSFYTISRKYTKLSDVFHRITAKYDCQFKSFLRCYFMRFYLIFKENYLQDFFLL